MNPYQVAELLLQNAEDLRRATPRTGERQLQLEDALDECQTILTSVWETVRTQIPEETRTRWESRVDSALENAQDVLDSCIRDSMEDTCK